MNEARAHGRTDGWLGTRGAGGGDGDDPVGRSLGLMMPVVAATVGAGVCGRRYETRLSLKKSPIGRPR